MCKGLQVAIDGPPRRLPNLAGAQDGKRQESHVKSGL